MFNFDATVIHHLQATRGGDGTGLLIDHAQLQPQHFGPNGHSLLGDGWGILRPAKNIHHVHRVVDCLQARKTALAKDTGVLGVDRHNAVAMLEHVFGRKVRRSVRLRRQAHHRQGTAPLQDTLNGVHAAHGLN